jgi:hypothetical protein
MRPLEHQLANAVRDFDRSGERGLSAVGVAEEENRFSDRLNHGYRSRGTLGIGRRNEARSLLSSSRL